jgi:GNAT superfamily N-acetyltransferase
MLIENEGSLVGVAGFRDVEGPQSGACALSWVGVDPAHRGRGLGKELTALAIDAAVAGGKSLICLSTDDFRIPAIRTYLSVGFRPCLGSWDRSHHWRWSRIAGELKCKLKFCSNPSHRAPIAALGGVAAADGK